MKSTKALEKILYTCLESQERDSDCPFDQTESFKNLTSEIKKWA